MNDNKTFPLFAKGVLMPTFDFSLFPLLQSCLLFVTSQTNSSNPSSIIYQSKCYIRPKKRFGNKIDGQETQTIVSINKDQIVNIDLLKLLSFLFWSVFLLVFTLVQCGNSYLQRHFVRPRRYQPYWHGYEQSKQKQDESNSTRRYREAYLSLCYLGCLLQSTLNSTLSWITSNIISSYSDDFYEHSQQPNWSISK